MQVITWTGSIEIGVLECDPNTIELPSCAMNLRHGSWLMTGCAIFRDGEQVVETYGVDLNDLEVGHTVGVMRTSNVSYNLLANAYYFR